MQRVHLHFLIDVWQYQLLGSWHRVRQQIDSPVEMLVSTCFSASSPGIKKSGMSFCLFSDSYLQNVLIEFYHLLC